MQQVLNRNQKNSEVVDEDDQQRRELTEYLSEMLYDFPCDLT